MKKQFLVLSALGKDRPGLIDRLSASLLDCGCNIEDSRMSVLGGEFALILLISGKWNGIAKLEQRIERLQEELELTIIIKETAPRAVKGDALPYAVDVVCVDQPGIVHHIAGFFSSREINIEDMTTHSYAAPHTGTPMFSVHMTVGVPAALHIAQLREEFLDFTDSLNLDAVFEPVKG